MWLRSLTACLLAAVASGGIAHADKVARADECADAAEHLVIARRALDVGDRARAISEYKLSYELDGRPLTLLLLARAYEDGGEPLLALDLYRRYAGKLPPERRSFAVDSEIARLSARALDARIPIFDDSDEGTFRSLPVFDEADSRR